MAELNQASTASAAEPADPGGNPTTSPPAETPPRARATLFMTSAVTAVALMIYTAPMVTLPETAAALKTPLSAQAWLLNGTPLGLAALLLVVGSLAIVTSARSAAHGADLAVIVSAVLSVLAALLVSVLKD